jgi:hypothetical protein
MLQDQQSIGAWVLSSEKYVSDTVIWNALPIAHTNPSMYCVPCMSCKSITSSLGKDVRLNTFVFRLLLWRRSHSVAPQDYDGVNKPLIIESLSLYLLTF